jgi:hypothetical protein
MLRLTGLLVWVVMLRLVRAICLTFSASRLSRSQTTFYSPMAAVPNCEVRRTNAFACILFLSPIQCIAKIAPHIAIGVGSAIKGRKVGWAETWGLERLRLPPMMASLAMASHCPAHPLPEPKPDRLVAAHWCSCSLRFDTAPDKRPPH